MISGSISYSISFSTDIPFRIHAFGTEWSQTPCSILQVSSPKVSLPMKWNQSHDVNSVKSQDLHMFMTSWASHSLVIRCCKACLAQRDYWAFSAGRKLTTHDWWMVGGITSPICSLMVNSMREASLCCNIRHCQNMFGTVPWLQLKRL